MTHSARGRPGLAGGDPHPLRPRAIHGSQPNRAGQSRQGSAGGKLGPQAGSWAPRLPKKSAGARGQG